jgi:hypothetical protein
MSRKFQLLVTFLLHIAVADLAKLSARAAKPRQAYDDHAVSSLKYARLRKLARHILPAVLSRLRFGTVDYLGVCCMGVIRDE